MNYVNYNHDYRRNRFVEPTQMLTAANIFTPTSDQKHMLGCILDLNDGRRFRYCRAGETLYKALMTQSEAPQANWTEQAMTGYSASAGDTSVQILLATAVVAHDLDDGWLLVTDVTTDALGDMYLIKSHTTGTTPTLQLADQGGIRTALTATSEVSVIMNKYREVIHVVAAAATSVPTGVPLVDVTDTYYFWAQTKGPCPLIVDTDNVVVGNYIGETATSNVAGGGGIIATDGTLPFWGIVMNDCTASQTDQPVIVDLMLE